MRTYKLLVAIILFSAFAKAQTNEILDTIYANDKTNVALFFPSPVRQGITGTKNFIFTHNREKEQYFGLLQAQPGNSSNLLIINKNGLIFSYIVKYKKKLSRLNYFIETSSAIGNVVPKTVDTISLDSVTSVSIKNEAYYKRFSEYLLTKKNSPLSLKKRNEKIILELKNLVFEREALYFVIQIENNSTLDYDLNFLELSIATRKKGKKRSIQTLQLAPNYIYGLPKIITEGQRTSLVYVVPKFSISDERYVFLELNELNGERNLQLKVSNNYINNPN